MVELWKCDRELGRYGGTIGVFITIRYVEQHMYLSTSLTSYGQRRMLQMAVMTRDHGVHVHTAILELLHYAIRRNNWMDSCSPHNPDVACRRHSVRTQPSQCSIHYRSPY